jgi:hypothetical protein
MHSQQSQEDNGSQPKAYEESESMARARYRLADAGRDLHPGWNQHLRNQRQPPRAAITHLTRENSVAKHRLNTQDTEVSAPLELNRRERTRSS